MKTHIISYLLLVTYCFVSFKIGAMYDDSSSHASVVDESLWTQVSHLLIKEYSDQELVDHIRDLLKRPIRPEEKKLAQEIQTFLDGPTNLVGVYRVSTAIKRGLEATLGRNLPNRQAKESSTPKQPEKEKSTADKPEEDNPASSKSSKTFTDKKIDSHAWFSNKHIAIGLSSAVFIILMYKLYKEYSTQQQKET